MYWPAVLLYKFSEMPQREQIEKQSGMLVQMCFKSLLQFDRWEPVQNYIKVEAIKPGRPDTSKFVRELSAL